ncbi:hypothetical protein KJ695_03460 [Patescibacteria group bacterium]|nr:hypothetical protein [Patescibacteria group bacterium]MBU4056938.1 hypothetical protein [Patescibacteria group bacterium]MBU4368801.1 hypothetical protein [Patescibacteria group bacterium]
MKIESIKNINITALFASPINHLLIGQEMLLDLFKTGDEEKDKRTFVEAPGLKVLIFPNRKKEYVFEGTRILVNDKNEVLPNDSDVIDDFEKIIKSDMVEQNKVAAFGFNYDTVIIPENSSFKSIDLVGSKVAAIKDIKSAGVNILFEKDGVTYVLEIKPIGSEQKFVAHFNAHFSTNKLPDTKELKEKINKEFLKFKNTIEKI